MRSFSQGCVQDAQIRFQKAKNESREGGAKNAFLEERAKVKGKTLGDESPRPAFFFTRKKRHISSGYGLNGKNTSLWRNW
ncbi:MAG: hypothetical protein H7834_07515 [Magnetococcus sp. YQC-9]